MEQFNIGIIGCGFVGKAVAAGFELHVNSVKMYDKYETADNYDTLDDTVNSSDYLFVCVPTPTDKNGEQDLSALNDALIAIDSVCTEGKLIIIKSTVLPGTTKKLEPIFLEHNFVFNPEFLSARTARLDFINPSRIILGGDKYNTNKVANLYKLRFGNTVPIYQTSFEVAEFTKYMANCFFSTKVAFVNEMYDITQAIGIDYNEVKELWLLDGKVAHSHCDVPGHDGKRGYGGACLVAGTQVISQDTLINIEDIEVGDNIWDGKQFTEVTTVGSREVESVVKITARGRSLIGSKDHIHIIYKNGKETEVNLCDIKIGDELIIYHPPKIKESLEIELGKKPNNYFKWWPEQFIINEQFARVIGMYIGDGYSNDSEKAVVWTMGEKKDILVNELIETLNSIGLYPKKRFIVTNGTYGESRCWNIRIRSVGVYKLLQQLCLGSNALNKNIPFFQENIAKNILGGWFDTDGSLYKGTLSGYSRSKQLIKNIDYLLLSMGICCNIGHNGEEIRVSRKNDVIELCKFTKRLKFDANVNSYADPTIREIDRGWAVKVNGVEIQDANVVHSIETKSHRYVANSFATHNCFPKDVNAFKKWAEDKNLNIDILKATSKWGRDD